MNPTPTLTALASFTPVPSRHSNNAVDISVGSTVPEGLDAIGYLIQPAADLPAGLGVGWEALRRVGFEGKPGEILTLPRDGGPIVFACGAGETAGDTGAELRAAAANFARAASRFERIAVVPGAMAAGDAALAGQCLTEGALLARYRFTELRPTAAVTPLVSLDIVVPVESAAALQRGTRRGEILARVTNLVRDLVNTPPGYLTAARFAEVATRLGEEEGLTVEVADRTRLVELGCGGLLGVNAGSSEEPRMITLTYTPSPHHASAGETPRRLALVGKGIMYDSGGISLKPSDESHLAMKMDMAGAAAVLGSMLALGDLGCPVEVTGYLMCTDNMPSGSAVKLGDVLTIHGGTTVEVKNTDAEGRLVMSDALVLASEQSPDAIVDIATLTGAALMALGPRIAAVIGNNQNLIDRVTAAGRKTDEALWQLPLEHHYRRQLDSEVADLSNMAGKYAGATTAALFLNEFVAGIPWAHLDIAGTMRSDVEDEWRTRGATGFGTRLLVELALGFATR